MNPLVKRCLMTVAAALIAGLATLPQFGAFSAALTGLAGALVGGAHIPRPGDAS